MLRGTRIMTGKEAALYVEVCDKVRECLKNHSFEEVILPAIWEQETFTKKAGPEIVGQMFTFSDKGERQVCLIPEATAVVQDMWNASWKGSHKHPHRVFYIQRCYRYERPQAGRYREFTQAGIEILGGPAAEMREEAIALLNTVLSYLGVNATLNAAVKRGLSYYIEDGFEAEVASLGAQKQVAGGGRYAEGVGWAIGVDRIVMALLQGAQ